MSPVSEKGAVVLFGVTGPPLKVRKLGNTIASVTAPTLNSAPGRKPIRAEAVQHGSIAGIAGIAGPMVETAFILFMSMGPTPEARSGSRVKAVSGLTKRVPSVMTTGIGAANAAAGTIRKTIKKVSRRIRLPRPRLRHIARAINHPFASNVSPQGLYRKLRFRWDE